MKLVKYDLIKYRDIGMSTYTYFYVNVNKNNSVASPFFDNINKATSWLKEQSKDNNERTMD